MLSLAEDLLEAVFAQSVFPVDVAPVATLCAFLYSDTSCYVVTKGQSHLTCVNASFNQRNLPQPALFLSPLTLLPI